MKAKEDSYADESFEKSANINADDLDENKLPSVLPTRKAGIVKAKEGAANGERFFDLEMSNSKFS